MIREHRNFILDERLVLISPYDPLAGFNVGHAMQSNTMKSKKTCRGSHVLLRYSASPSAGGMNPAAASAARRSGPGMGTSPAGRAAAARPSRLRVPSVMARSAGRGMPGAGGQCCDEGHGRPRSLRGQRRVRRDHAGDLRRRRRRHPAHRRGRGAAGARGRGPAGGAVLPEDGPAPRGVTSAAGAGGELSGAGVAA